VSAVVSLVLFGWLAAAVLNGQTMYLDNLIRDSIHARAYPRLTSAMVGISMLGSPSILIPLAMLLIGRFAWIGRRRAAMVFAVAAGGAEALDQVLKEVFRRARPEAFFGYAQPLGYSFPSGHSVESCCFYGVAAALVTLRMRSRRRKAPIWVASAFLTAAIGFSRIYLGVHYPSDVLAGYLGAVFWVSLVRVGYEIRSQKNQRRPAPEVTSDA
jgi:undecaprenyl-diphosphatase